MVQLKSAHGSILSGPPNGRKLDKKICTIFVFIGSVSGMRSHASTIPGSAAEESNRGKREEGHGGWFRYRADRAFHEDVPYPGIMIVTIQCIVSVDAEGGRTCEILEGRIGKGNRLRTQLNRIVVCIGCLGFR